MTERNTGQIIWLFLQGRHFQYLILNSCFRLNFYESEVVKLMKKSTNANTGTSNFFSYHRNIEMHEQ